MAKFADEEALASVDDTWERVQSLVTVGKTVEVFRRTIGGEVRLYLRVWTGKRKDGSNLVNADSDADY